MCYWSIIAHRLCLLFREILNNIQSSRPVSGIVNPNVAFRILALHQVNVIDLSSIHLLLWEILHNSQCGLFVLFGEYVFKVHVSVLLLTLNHFDITSNVFRLFGLFGEFLNDGQIGAVAVTG